MGRLKIKKNITETKLIWDKVRYCIDFLILICCLVVVFNMHPNENVKNNNVTEESNMIYIFHDYNWNQYVLNDTIHGSASSWDYLFDDEIPNSIKAGDEITNSVSLANITWNSQNTVIDDTSDTKNNQISFEEIMADLWFDDSHSVDNSHWEWNDTLIINLSDVNSEIKADTYSIKEESLDNEDSSLIIEKIDESENEVLSAKTFTFTSEWWVIPSLLPRDELYLNSSSRKSISYVNNNWSGSTRYNWGNSGGVSIVEDYPSCMTPWWYKIVHWDSVLAYQQTDKNSEICNIERRFCWKWKLSGTYTQQWCYTNKSSSNKGITNKNANNGERWEDEMDKGVSEQERIAQNNQSQNWSITTTQPLGTGSFVFNQPSQTSTEFYTSDNVRPEDEDIEQTKRPHWDCTTQWWEKVKHGSFVQAFKHANWFSDAPCEMQIRLCTMWDLMWTYTESTCKAWDTSFIDWINGSPTRDTYSKEKLELIKKQLKAEKNYEKDYWRYVDSYELDKILSILDK